MSSKYISCADTAKLIRQALKESFPGIKFSVTSKTYSGGASINVGWIDGPNDAQVQAVAGIFSGAYFDGQTDYKGSTYALVDGIQTRFGADFIFFNRRDSDAAVQRAIDRVSRDYAGNFAARSIAPPAVADYRSGDLYTVYPMDAGDSYWNLQSIIRRVLAKSSDRLAVAKSKTAGKVIYLGNDGYSQCGALSAEAVES
ncbi:MAG: LPD29 domain-containing protein [Pseudomonadota bacterium]